MYCFGQGQQQNVLFTYKRPILKKTKKNQFKCMLYLEYFHSFTLLSDSLFDRKPPLYEANITLSKATRLL